MIININYTKGPGSLEEAFQNLEENLSPAKLRKEINAMWKHIAKPMVADFQKILPVKKGGYAYSHPSVINYGRKAGDMRKSVKFKLAKGVPADALPRAYLRVDNFPYNFLVNGTSKRKNYSTNANRGAILDAISENSFFDQVIPFHLDNALDYLQNSSGVKNLFDKK